MASFSSQFFRFWFDFFCLGKKYLVFNLVGRNLKIKYRRSIIGFLWTIVTPMLMTAVYYFVFSSVLKIKTPFHHVFLLLGVMHWGFIGPTIMEGMESIVGNGSLLTKVPVPLQVFPMVGALTNFVTLLLSMPVLLGVAWISGVPFSGALLLMPIYWLILFVIVYSLSVILSLAFVLFRDLRHAMGIAMMVWFYVTPVVFDERMIPEKYNWVLYANPFGMFFAHLHQIWIQGVWPDLAQLGVILSWASVIFSAAFLMHRYGSHEIVEQI